MSTTPRTDEIEKAAKGAMARLMKHQRDFAEQMAEDALNSDNSPSVTSGIGGLMSTTPRIESA